MSVLKPACGQLWRATRNPYPLKGHPSVSIPWDLGVVYEVVEVCDMSRCHHVNDIIAFKRIDDDSPMSGWEIGEDSFLLGFQYVGSNKGGRA